MYKINNILWHVLWLGNVIWTVGNCALQLNYMKCMHGICRMLGILWISFMSHIMCFSENVILTNIEMNFIYRVSFFTSILYASIHGF